MGIGAAVAAAIWGIPKLVNKFRGGEEGTQVNPARDAFLAQFGGGGTGLGSGFGNLAAKLTEVTGEGGGGRLFSALKDADTMNEFNAAVQAIVTTLAEAEAKAKDLDTAVAGVADTAASSSEATAAAYTASTEEMTNVIAVMAANSASSLAEMAASGKYSAEELSKAQMAAALQIQAAYAEFGKKAATSLDEARERGGVLGRDLVLDFVQAAKAAGDSADAIEKSFQDIRLPELRGRIKYEVDLPDGEMSVPGAAAGGLFSTPSMRVIAEREPEIVGSPNVIVDALTQAMRRAGLSGGGATPEPHAGPIALSVSLQMDVNGVLDSGGLEQLAQRQIFPALVRAVEDSVAGLRTDLRDALGVGT